MLVHPLPFQDGKTVNNELEVVEGMKFDRGFISPYFITDQKAQTVEFEKPVILLVESKISSLASLVPLLENVIKTQRSLLIIAEDVEVNPAIMISSSLFLFVMFLCVVLTLSLTLSYRATHFLHW